MALTQVLDNRLLRAIAHITVYHAEVEHWIDRMVMVLHMSLPGAKKFTKRYPTTFAAELAFLTDCFKGLPSLRPLRRRALRLLQQAHTIHDDRSHIVHGYLRYWDKAEKRLAFMRVWKPPKSDAQMVVYSISEDGLIADAKRVSTFRKTALKFAQRLDKICLPKKNAQEAFGGLYR
jgi:hypothetical protein